MMKLIEKLSGIWEGAGQPFLIHKDNELKFSQIATQKPVDLSLVKPGDVVAIIGDFNPACILTLLHLIDLGAIVVPLTVETRSQHEYFFESALVDVVIGDGAAGRRNHNQSHELIELFAGQRACRSGSVFNRNHRTAQGDPSRSHVVPQTV